MREQFSSRQAVMLLMASSLLLSGCGAVGLAAGAGAAVGIGAAKEGGLGASVTDESIRLKISDLWFKRDVNMFGKLNLNVNQGRVLVTGVVQKPEDRVEAIRLAWQPSGVKQVINEIRVGKSETFGSYAQDMWISGQLRTRLTFDKNVQSINYSIETVQGTVYLMGVAQSQRELDTVISIARKIKGVKEVVSYTKFAGDPVTSSADATMLTTQPVPNTMQNGAQVPPVQSEPVPLTNDYPQDMQNTQMQSPSSIQSEILPP
ncbi:MAG: BON domain-containing protein [Pseudobdellovibrionaceae bacterium]